MISLYALAKALGGTCVATQDHFLHQVAPLDSAGPQDLVFILEPKYLSKLSGLSCAALVVPKDIPTKIPYIVVKNPRKALAQTLQLLYPKEQAPPIRHAMSAIDPSAFISDNVSVGAFSSIAADTAIGDNTYISERVSIGKGCRIGQHCYLHPGVTLYPKTQIGNRVIVHAGTVIGADGFGYVPDTDGLLKMPHIGGVVIEDSVEIGANCTIDRGCLGDTVIETGVKIDNLVHISHNTRIGAHSVIAAQCGFVGSAQIGSFVQMGGQVGVSRVTIGDHVVIAAKAGVTKDVPPNATFSGFPAWDHHQEIQKEAFLRRLYKKSKEK